MKPNRRSGRKQTGSGDGGLRYAHTKPTQLRQHGGGSSPPVGDVVAEIWVWHAGSERRAAGLLLDPAGSPLPADWAVRAAAAAAAPENSPHNRLFLLDRTRWSTNSLLTDPSWGFLENPLQADENQFEPLCSRASIFADPGQPLF